MKNKFGRLTESRKLEMLQMSVEEIYEVGYDVGYSEGHEAGYEVGAYNERTEACEAQASKSQNQRRAELIQRAREFVEEHGEEYGFIKQDNLVVAIHKKYDGKKNGYACCRESDVFNFWIGKAIALARALEIEIPQEFLQAVQPDEKVAGMRVAAKEHMEGIFILIPRGEKLSDEKAHIASPVGKDGIIIDDTHAEYEVS